MKKFLLGVLLGIFTLVGISVLTNYTSADDWAIPDAHDNCIHEYGYKYGPSYSKNVLFQSIVYAELIALSLCFILTLILYFLYKHKKHENPLKDAINKSWPRWIVIFILIVCIPIAKALLYEFDIL